MEMALYEPGLGYYSTGAGFGRDFLTSPDTHPVFGALLAGLLVRIWEELGRPRPFTVCELGAGTGSLARAILEALDRKDPDCAGALDYAIVEVAAALVDRQKNTLSDKRVRWGALPREITGVVLSNELFDALPIHVLTDTPAGPGEILVGWDDGLVEVAGPFSRAAIRKLAEHCGRLPEPGGRSELNIAAMSVMRKIGRSLKRGAVVSIDYGYTAEDRAEVAGKCGSLLCYHRGSVSDSPLINVGEQDLTSHVDFAGLIEVGLSAGLQPAALKTQRRFLRDLGLDRYLAGLRSIDIDYSTREHNDRRIRLLANPSGLGKFKVLVQGRGVDLAPVLADSRYFGDFVARAGQPLLDEEGDFIWSNQ